MPLVYDGLNYYEVLDLSPNASAQEIREGYLRSKASYYKDNLVLYTLISEDEREDALQKIEQAYQVLSDPEKRKEYDCNYLVFDKSSVDSPFSFVSDLGEDPAQKKARLVELDKGKGSDEAQSLMPMEADGTDSLLIAPTTDLNRSTDQETDLGQESKPRASTSKHSSHEAKAKKPTELPRVPEKSTTAQSSLSDQNPRAIVRPQAHLKVVSTEMRSSSSLPQEAGVLSTEESGSPKTDKGLSLSSNSSDGKAASSSQKASGIIGQGGASPSLGAPAEPWTGNLLKETRERLQVSIEEMSGITKVSKNYLRAIEGEEFAKLPAAVYVRGFVIQIAKVLKLPHEKVVADYMIRYQSQRAQSEE